MRSAYRSYREKAMLLRKKGKTYGEIRNSLKVTIPKSTLSLWCKDVVLSKMQSARIDKMVTNNARQARAIRMSWHNKHLSEILESVAHLERLLRDKNIAKIALAMLYLGEGAKTRKSSLMFGNSNPVIIALFLRLLRHCYAIDERKFRCTLQCRADQNVKVLQAFWSRTTKISPHRFYKAQIDPRTIGKPSMNPDYKGVCRIDYFSADIFSEIKSIIKVIAGR